MKLVLLWLELFRSTSGSRGFKSAIFAYIALTHILNPINS